jgi:uncharacterized protein YfaS (alpha-2-macroglobulin family)
MRAPIRGALLLAVAACGLGQGENEPYFSLSSSRTFPSNGKPSIRVSAWKVDSLEFRVYRVADPVQFFQQIENPHQFGAASPAPPRERTLLERIHAWKRHLRADIRRSLRGQFTESPSAHLLPRRGGRAEAAKPATAIDRQTHYAEAPLLNSQQLVLSFVQAVQTRQRWDQQTIELALHDKGVYLVEAVKGQLRAYTVVLVTDSVLITKAGKGRIVNLVVDRNTGEPVRGARVWMLTREARLAEAETAANGIAEMKIAAGRPEDVRVVGRNGADFMLNTLSTWSFRPNAADFRGYVYTDRPVYRPGHTVRFRGILRWRTASGYDVPAGKPVSVEVQDAEQKPVYRKTLTTNANGSIHDEFVLGPAAALGNYYISVKSGEDQAGGNFEVEEYKKPEYEVRVTPSKTRVLQGESVQAAIDSRYYFGEPVSGAKVQYSVYRDRYWFPLWYDPEDDTGGPEEGSDESGDEVAQGERQLDADGKLTISFDTTVSDNKFDYSYRVEARVTDQGKREITGKSWVVATYGTFVVNVQPERYVCPPGAPARFKVEARDYDFKPVSTRVRVELLHWDWRHTERSRIIATADVDTGPDGTATAALPIPPEGGTYRIRATAKTPEGREVEDYSFAYVAGGGDFGSRAGTDIKIITDQKTYRAGETAKLLIAAVPNTPVYVSVEGRDLRELKTLRSTGPTIEYEVPIAAADEPGLTVSAAYVRKGSFYTGMKYVRVPPVSHQLNVRLAADKPQYQPGQTAEYSLEVSGSDGRPAPRAEFSLGVVDEAIYGVRKDTTPEIIGFFFGREWNSVYTDNSLTYYFTGEAGKRRMLLASIAEPSRLAQLKPERLAQPKIRKAFPDTAFWTADLVTDAAGRARAKVEFPDSLTTWRATVRGATPDTRVGGAVLKTIVRKNLILRLVVPRFFVQGDELVISALVHNYLAEAKSVRVSLDVTGLDLLEGTTREVQVPSRGEAKVDWRVRARQVRSATVLGKALADEESDALQLELPVNVPGVKMSQARGGALAPGVSEAFDLAFPEKVEPGSRRLSVRVSPSIAGSLFGALEYLTSYPYGCVEQTMSSFLPDIIVTQAVRELNLKADLNEAELQDKIRAGLDRLYNFQHEDGGWGWWETDDTHPFMTAYVVAGLAQAKAAGAQVKDQAVQKGVEWLKAHLASDTRLAGDLRAYMAYALTVAGQPDPAALAPIYGIRGKLSPYGLAVLGLAFEQAKDPRAAEIAAALESAARQDGEQAWWPATRDELLDFSADATPEATAFAVKFLSHQRRDHPLLPRAALWLMNHRSEGYRWSSTKETAMVIYGLTDYVKATGELNSNVTASVFVNDSPVLTRKLDQATAVGSSELVLDESKLQTGVNHIRVTSSGEGRLYYSVRAEYFSTDEKLQKAGSVSLNVLRDYFKLSPAKDGDKIIYDLAPLAGPVSSGDTIAVRLTVSGSEWKYLMIEDPIPSGAEFIERDQVYQLKDNPPWWRWEFTRRELHDDRITIFQTWFPQGQQQYFYLLKVVNPGTFKISPTRVGPMYQSNIFATSENRRLEAK